MKVGLHCALKNLVLEITLIPRFYEFLLLSPRGRFTSSSQEIRCLSKTMGNERSLILRRVPESWWRWEWNEMSLTIERVRPSCSTEFTWLTHRLDWVCATPVTVCLVSGVWWQVGSLCEDTECGNLFTHKCCELKCSRENWKMSSFLLQLSPSSNNKTTLFR